VNYVYPVKAKSWTSTSPEFIGHNKGFSRRDIITKNLKDFIHTYGIEMLDAFFDKVFLQFGKNGSWLLEQSQFLFYVYP
jgi:hypothetical protein